MNVLLFQPFSGIWPHTILEKQLMESLSRAKFNLSLLSCGGVFETLCPAQENYGHSINSQKELRKQVCQRCSFATGLMIQNNRFIRSEKLETYVSQEVREEISKYVSDIKLEDLSNQEFLNRADVKAACYELIIRYKIRNFELNNEQFEYFINSLTNYMIVKKTIRNAFDELNPEVLVIHSPQYAVNSAAADVAKSMGKKVYFLGSNGNLSEIYTSLRVYDWFKFGLLNPAPTQLNLADYQLGEYGIERLGNHIETAKNAKSIFVYSQPANRKSTREVFSIPAEKRIYLLALSSYDEFYAAEQAGYMTGDFSTSSVYKSQTEWVKETVKWAQAQENIVLIIRPHPREYSNRRETRIAPRDPELQQILETKQEWLRTDSPDLKFPIENHFREIDVMLISWSSTGIDALFNGIPVIAYDRKLARFPEDLVLNGSSHSDYLNNLNKSIHLGKSLLLRDLAMKWFDYSQHKGALLLPGRTVYSNLIKKSRILTSLFYRAEHFSWRQVWKIESKIMRKKIDVSVLELMFEKQKSSFYELDL